jgi:hypothetical protein
VRHTARQESVFGKDGYGVYEEYGDYKVDKRSVWSLSRVVQEGSGERRQAVRCSIKEIDAPAARSSKVARFSGYDVL